ncbi:MAG: hypothetical protein K8L97_22970 [Anaerolineae bacterium]|nr:hypothetical protein [Anaerolineae bacterium]
MAAADLPDITTTLAPLICYYGEDEWLTELAAVVSHEWGEVFQKCEICTKSFAAFLAYYEPILVRQTHPDKDDDTDDNPALCAQTHFRNRNRRNRRKPTLSFLETGNS